MTTATTAAARARRCARAAAGALLAVVAAAHAPPAAAQRRPVQAGAPSAARSVDAMVRYFGAYAELVGVTAEHGLGGVLPRRAGESTAAWAARLERSAPLVRALRDWDLSALEYLTTGQALYYAWLAHLGTPGRVAPDPRVLALVRANAELFATYARIAPPCPWPGGPRDRDR